MPEPQPQQQITEEQVKALQEKIKNMSPEELKEFQKKQCIFCQIISGKVQSKKIYEDDTALVILDVNPANPGHMLIMPKEHYSIMPQIPDSQLSHIFSVAKALSNAALRALESQGTNIIAANGVAAGQKAQHFMVHLIPRMENDGIKFELPQKTLAEDELQKMSSILSKALGAKFEEKKKARAVPVLPQKKEFGEKPKEKLAEKLPLENKKFVAAEFKEKKKPAKENQVSGKKAQKEESPPINLDDIANLLGKNNE